MSDDREDDFEIGIRAEDGDGHAVGEDVFDPTIEIERLELNGGAFSGVVADLFAEPLEMIVEARRKFVETLRDKEFQQILRGPDDAESKKLVSQIFHETLDLMKKNSLCDYVKLADRVDVSRSQVNRWFKPDKKDAKPSMPTKLVRIGAMTELANLIEEETEAMARAIRATAKKDP